MATNREVYEGKILETLIKNSERLAVVEQKLIILDQKIDSVETKVDSYKLYFITIIIGIVINIFSQPIVNWLF